MKNVMLLLYGSIMILFMILPMVIQIKDFPMLFFVIGGYIASASIFIFLLKNKTNE